MNRRSNIYTFKGVEYSSSDLCKLFNVTRNRVEYISRKYKLDFLEAAKESLTLQKRKREVFELAKNRELITPLETNENHVEFQLSEYQVCSYFTCDRKLSLTEKLCGDRCLKHQGGR